MKILLITILSIISFSAEAFTLNNSLFASFSNDEITINVSSSSDCSATGLTNDEILSLANEAVTLFWNRVSTSRLRIRQGALLNASSNFNTGAICSSGTSGSCTPNQALVVSDNILIACNTNSSNFSNSSYVMAVALPNNITSNTINGALILLNGTGTSTTNSFAISTREQKISILAHEIGHAVGLGHSAVKDSLMYFQSLENRKSLGWDDIQGVTYLYPKEQPISCSSITNKESTRSSTMWQIMLFFFLTIFITLPFSKES